MYSMIRFIGAFFLVCAAALLPGCAPAIISPEQMRAQTATFELPKLPDPDKAIVYVIRPSKVAPLIRFNVFLDDHEDSSEMGYNRGNQFIYFQANPGDHKVFSKAENWAETFVSLKAGDIAYLRQEPAMGLVIARNKIFLLNGDEGKFLVMNARPGTILKTAK
jgi:hypothetical protein